MRGISVDKARTLVRIFCEQYIPPVLDTVDLTFLIKNAIDTPGVDDRFVDSIFILFSEKNLCRTYEVISTIVLLCDGDWKTRLDLIFEIFKCAGTEEIYHEDIRMAIQAISVGLCKLWKQPRWTSDELYRLSENLANHAFMKVEKDMDDTLKRAEFNSWAFERLKESRTIANWDSLKAILESSHLVSSAPPTPRVSDSGKMGVQREDLVVIDVNNDGEEEPLSLEVIPKMNNNELEERELEVEVPLFLDENVDIDDMLNKGKGREINDALYLEKAADDITGMLRDVEIELDENDGNNHTNDDVAAADTNTDIDAVVNDASEAVNMDTPSKPMDGGANFADAPLAVVTEVKDEVGALQTRENGVENEKVGEENLKNIKNAEAEDDVFDLKQPQVQSLIATEDDDNDSTSVISDITAMTRAIGTEPVLR